MSWSVGEWVVRREVLGVGPWLGVLVKFIEDTPQHLVSYIPTGSPFGFPVGTWLAANGVHPWSNRTGWQGPGCLMIQRPGDAYAVWHFWVIGTSVSNAWRIRASSAGEMKSALTVQPCWPSWSMQAWMFRLSTVWSIVLLIAVMWLRCAGWCAGV